MNPDIYIGIINIVSLLYYMYCQAKVAGYGFKLWLYHGYNPFTNVYFLKSAGMIALCHMIVKTMKTTNAMDVKLFPALLIWYICRTWSGMKPDGVHFYVGFARGDVVVDI